MLCHVSNGTEWLSVVQRITTGSYCVLIVGCCLLERVVSSCGSGGSCCGTVGGLAVAIAIVEGTTICN